ncbi:MAG: S1C family serine protease [Aeromicrobium sp.]
MMNTPGVRPDSAPTANVSSATATPPRRSVTPALAAVLALALVAGAIAGTGSALALTNLIQDGQAAASTAESTGATVSAIADDSDATETTVSAVVAEAADAVVSLEVEGVGVFPGQSTTGSGSGFFVSVDGLIVTAYHVIEDARAIIVVLADGTETTATVVAADPDNDVAILDAEGQGYVTLAMATTDVVVGQAVIAIGNALGEYQTTVTTGVVSGTNRSIEVADGRSSMALDGLLQTDAALASGMSGGPILNLAGEVVGVSAADASNSDGIAFAEPISVAAELLVDLGAEPAA